MARSGRGALYNIAIVYLGKVLGVLISTLTLGAITRYLGLEQFGYYSVVLTYSALIVSVADLGIGWIVAREIARGNQAAFIPLRSAKYVVAGVVVAASLFLLPVLGYAAPVKQGVVLLALFTFLTAVNSFQVGVLQGSHELNKTVYGDTLGRLVLLGAILIVRHYDLGIGALFLSLNLVSLTVYVCNAWYITRLGYTKRPWSLQGVWEFAYDFRTMPAVIAISYIVYKVDMLILARMASEVDVGIYSTAYRILDVATAIPSIFVGVLAPIFSNRLSAGDELETKRVFSQSFSGLCMIAGPIAIALVFLAPYAVRLIAGSGYLNASTQQWFGNPVTSTIVLQILAIYLFFSFFGSYFSSVLLAAKRQVGLIITGGVGLLLSVIGNIVLIPHYSYLASALLTAVVEVVIISGMVWFLSRSKIASGSRNLFFESLLMFGIILWVGFATGAHPLLSGLLGPLAFVISLPLINPDVRKLALQVVGRMRRG